MLEVAIALAVGFALTNGVHDAANAVATLVATRAARPAQAIAVATVANLVGPFLVGAAVADTVAGIVTTTPAQTIDVITAGLAGAVVWNVVTWRLGLPSSSGHALVGGLVGAGLAAGGPDVVAWGGFDGLRPEGVAGTLVALAVSPVLGLGVAVLATRAARRASRRAGTRWRGPVRGAQWVTAATLAVAHGANDTQKSVGLVAALLVAGGHADVLDAPSWTTLLCAGALTFGTALGGWTIVRTVGRRIYRLTPVDGLASQTTSAGVVLAASFLGAPVSTTQVVASSVVGVGIGERRGHHVNWTLVRHIGLAWLVTLPASAALAVGALGVIRVTG